MTVSSPRDVPPAEEAFVVEPPDISGIEIDDGAPVDNIYSEKQMRLLVESLNASWEGPPPRAKSADQTRVFLALANVGCFATTREPPLVPDVMLSLDVQGSTERPREKRHLTYFIWEFGKPPDLVIEVVSNRKGGELDRKKRGYARMRVAYYAVWDPEGHLGAPGLSCFELRGDLYIPLAEAWFPAIGLGLVEWSGKYEQWADRWLRWQRKDGTLLATGAESATRETERAEQATERAEQATERAEQATERAEQATERAEQETERADREAARAQREAERAAKLAARLRELGLDDPDD